MATEALTPEILCGGETPASRFDPRNAASFVNKLVSEETRRAYGYALREFFQFVGMKHPAELVPHDVVLGRDSCGRRERARRPSPSNSRWFAPSSNS